MSSFNPVQQPDDTLWAAFRYAHGEMPADEATAFEARLAVDQRLRECVASAVRLSAAVCAAESLAASPRTGAAADRRTTFPSRPAERPVQDDSGNSSDGLAVPKQRTFAMHTVRRIGWIAVAAAAVCGAFFVGLNAARRSADDVTGASPLAESREGRVGDSRSDEQDSRTQPGAGGMASQLVAFWAESWMGALSGESAAEAEFPDGLLALAGSPAEDADEASDEFRVPAWMLAAVASQQQPSPEHPEDELWEN